MAIVKQTGYTSTATLNPSKKVDKNNYMDRSLYKTGNIQKASCAELALCDALYSQG